MTLTVPLTPLKETVTQVWMWHQARLVFIVYVCVCTFIKNASIPMVWLLLPTVSWKEDTRTHFKLCGAEGIQEDLALVCVIITGSIWMPY